MGLPWVGRGLPYPCISFCLHAISGRPSRKSGIYLARYPENPPGSVHFELGNQQVGKLGQVQAFTRLRMGLPFPENAFDPSPEAMFFPAAIMASSGCPCNHQNLFMSSRFAIMPTPFPHPVSSRTVIPTRVDLA